MSVAARRSTFSLHWPASRGRVFVPLVYRLAARLEQLEWADFGDDPPTAAFALRATQRLLGLGALVSHYRLGAEAEACGVQLARDPLTGDWAVPPAPAAPAIIPGDPARRPPLDGLLDLTRRLASELQGEVAVIDVLTGPRTLGVLLGETAGLAELYAGLGRAYAESGARLLLSPRIRAWPRRRLPVQGSCTPCSTWRATFVCGCWWRPSSAGESPSPGCATSRKPTRWRPRRGY